MARLRGSKLRASSNTCPPHVPKLDAPSSEPEAPYRAYQAPPEHHQERAVVPPREEELGAHAGDAEGMMAATAATAPVKVCQRRNGKKWQCKNPAEGGRSICHYHYKQYQECHPKKSPSARMLEKKVKAAAKAAVAAAAAAASSSSSSDDHYYNEGHAQDM